MKETPPPKQADSCIPALLSEDVCRLAWSGSEKWHQQLCITQQCLLLTPISAGVAHHYSSELCPDSSKHPTGSQREGEVNAAQRRDVALAAAQHTALPPLHPSVKLCACWGASYLGWEVSPSVRDPLFSWVAVFAVELGGIFVLKSSLNPSLERSACPAFCTRLCQYEFSCNCTAWK